MLASDLAPKNARIQRIIAILQERNGSSVRDLAEELGVSEMTIRRDIDELDSTDVIRRVHGAVIYNPEFTNQAPIEGVGLDRDIAQQKALQRQLGQAASALINSNDMVLLDSGEIAIHMAQNLPVDRRLSLCTYSTAVFNKAAACSSVEHLYLIGGEYHADSSMCSSEFSADILKNFRFSKAFIFPDGIHSEFGITCAHLYEVASKRAAIASSVRTILVAESSLFDSVSRNYIVDLSAVHAVVTDCSLSESWRSRLSGLGIEVIFA